MCMYMGKKRNEYNGRNMGRTRSLDTKQVWGEEERMYQNGNMSCREVYATVSSLYLIDQ